jgi:predicted dinucleotide-binding enzyme
VNVETWDSLAMSPDSWAAEEITKLVPEGTPVVKVFNTTVAGTLGVQLTNRIACNETGTHRSRCSCWSCGRGGL